MWIATCPCNGSVPGLRPFVSRGYAMFVVSAEAIVSSLQIDPGDSAIDRLFESAQFFDSQGTWDLHFPGIQIWGSILSSLIQ